MIDVHAKIQKLVYVHGGSCLLGVAVLSLVCCWSGFCFTSRFPVWFGALVHLVSMTLARIGLAWCGVRGVRV